MKNFSIPQCTIFLLVHIFFLFSRALTETSDTGAEFAIAHIKPALVRLHVVTVYDDQGREAKYETVGSGVIITEQGHIITNHHVAGRAKRIVCTLANKEEIEAELIGTDPLADISVVKLKPQQKKTFSVATFGNSDRLKIGDRVFAMGSPLALSQSVTSGIVSNTELVIPEIFWPFRFTLEGEDVGSLVRWIGHDAAIYPGNSGGPLVNEQGEIVGINEINLGIGGAIPGNLAKKVAEELIQKGRVERSWFGLEVQPRLKGSDYDRGVLVSGVIEASPAAQAGFLPGDIVIKFNGQEVNVRFAEELPLFNQLLMDCPIGKKIEAVVERGNRKLVLYPVPVEREYVLPKTVELKEWGITVRNISLFLAKELKRKDQAGVLVTSVRPGGPCGEAKPSINNGDIITRVNDQDVRTIKDLIDFTKEIDRTRSVLVSFDRKDEEHLTVVKIGIEEIEPQGKELRKAWLGVAIQVLTREIAQALSLNGCQGVRITQVFKNTPAERAGIRVGDIITMVNGDSVRANSPADIDVFPVMIQNYKIGTEVVLTVLRGKKHLEIPVELGESPIPATEVSRYYDSNFELVVRDIAFMDRVQEKWRKDTRGVVVDDVTNGGWAALAHLAPGDLIIKMAGENIVDVESFKGIMKKIKAQKSGSIILQVVRGIHTFFVEVEPNWQKINE